MKRVFVLFLVAAVLITPISAFAKVDVLAGGWWDASLEELLSAREQIDAQIASLSANVTENNVVAIPLSETSSLLSLNKELSYGFLDHTMFSQYWSGDISGKVLRCGSDFEPGEYYIFSLWGANALYSVSSNPNDFSYSYERVMRKIHVEKGQYVMLTDAILVKAEDVDTSNWGKYGVFIVGKDLPAGEYKIETISKRYVSDLSNIDGIPGAYQISRNSPEAEPIECSSLFAESTYINLNDGEYIVINNAKMTLCEDSMTMNIKTPNSMSESTTESILLETTIEATTNTSQNEPIDKQVNDSSEKSIEYYVDVMSKYERDQSNNLVLIDEVSEMLTPSQISVITTMVSLHYNIVFSELKGINSNDHHMRDITGILACINPLGEETFSYGNDENKKYIMETLLTAVTGIGMDAINFAAEVSEEELLGYAERLYAVLNAFFRTNPTSLSLEYTNALKSAKSYIEYSGFSRRGLIEQLIYEGYSDSAASYAADHCGADWNQEAIESAAAYLNYSSFSRNGLIEQLEYEGFTNSQAIYGVTQNGY